jgi:hypothetical protein
MKKQKKSTSQINCLSKRGSIVTDTVTGFYRTARSRHLDINKLSREHFTDPPFLSIPTQLNKDNEKFK